MAVKFDGKKTGLFAAGAFYLEQQESNFFQVKMPRKYIQDAQQLSLE